MDRRAFIQAGGAGAAALAATPATLLHAAPARPIGSAPPPGAKHWVWMGGERTPDEWRPLLERARGAGITAALVNTSAEGLRAVMPAARDLGVEIHAWMVTMMEGGFEETHPEWYAVSREGKSTATDPPYVPYYKFMCPSRPEVKAHKVERARALLAVEGVAGLHLDYIRYPDVILPSGLWAKYGIVQDKEYPPYDYCYCDVCRAAFQARAGFDPLSLDDPSQNRAWVQYRYDTIVEMVNALSQTAHAAGKVTTAAVFPSPSIARQLVRQDWPRWPLDAVLPMVYNGFYEKGVDWIEPTVREGVAALGGRFPLYAGLFVPDLDPAALAEAARRAMAGGAAGISIFEGVGTSDAHWDALRGVLRA